MGLSIDNVKKATLDSIFQIKTSLLTRKKYSVGLLILLSLIIFLRNYNRFDPFLPGNLSGFYTYLNGISTSFDSLSTSSIYQILGAMSCELLNITPEIYLWFQPGAILTPLFLFFIYYVLSKNTFNSAFFVCIYLLGVLNPNSYYLFSHLPGNYILYTIVMGIVICLRKKIADSRSLLLGTILIIALNFASYNAMMRALLICVFLLIFVVIKYSLEKNTPKKDCRITAQFIHKIVVFLIISIFIYIIAEVFIDVLLPYMDSHSSSESTLLDRMIQLYGSLFGVSSISEYSDVIYHRTSSTSILTIVKYLIAGLIIIYYILKIFWMDIIGKRTLQFVDCFCLTLLCSYGSFIFIRMMASSIQFDLVFFPAIIIFIRLFCINYTDDNSQSIPDFDTEKQYFSKDIAVRQILTILFTVFVVCSIFSYVGGYSINSGITDDSEYNMFTTLSNSYSNALWTNNYIYPIEDKNIGLHTDIYTLSIYRLYLLVYDIIDNPDIISEFCTPLSLSEIQNVINNREGDAKYIVKNMNINNLAVGYHFEFAEPWIKFFERDNYNENYNKLYSSEDMEVISKLGD